MLGYFHMTGHLTSMSYCYFDYLVAMIIAGTDMIYIPFSQYYPTTERVTEGETLQDTIIPGFSIRG